MNLGQENKLLRECLEAFVYETTHLSPEQEDGSHWAKISKGTLEAARTLLKQVEPAKGVEILYNEPACPFCGSGPRDYGYMVKCPNGCVSVVDIQNWRALCKGEAHISA